MQNSFSSLKPGVSEWEQLEDNKYKFESEFGYLK